MFEIEGPCGCRRSDASLFFFVPFARTPMHGGRAAETSCCFGPGAGLCRSQHSGAERARARGPGAEAGAELAADRLADTARAPGGRAQRRGAGEGRVGALHAGRGAAHAVAGPRQTCCPCCWPGCSRRSRRRRGPGARRGAGVRRPVRLHASWWGGGSRYEAALLYRLGRDGCAYS